MQPIISKWRYGIRLYIAVAVVLVTLQTWWWANVTYGGSTLAATRMEEVFAWLSLAMITLAVSIGPTYKLVPRLPGRKLMADARRLIGVGAAWFASLHVIIAYDTLFKLANPLTLPQSYQQSFAVGMIALAILLAMAFTSFDRAFKGMGIWWFRLHRFVYIALLAILLHAFMTGAHAAGWVALISLTVAAGYLIAIHSYLAFVRAKRPTTWQLLAITYTLFLLITIFNYGYGQHLGYNPLAGSHGG